MIQLLRGDARRLPLADRSVHCCVTSPPYFGLRDYGTARWEGGDDEECDHKVRPSHTVASSGLEGGKATTGHWQEGYRDACGKCGARRVDRQLGLEATPGEYLKQMVAVFKEVYRVLHPTGTLWLNVGDSFGPGKQLMMMPHRLALALQEDGWIVRSDIVWAKCLSGGTMVYARTQKGEMPMTVKDMVRLKPDNVRLWDGQKWNQAMSWTPSPRKGDEIEIELRNGMRIGCTPDHRWPVTWGMGHDLVEARTLKVGDVLESCRLPGPIETREPAMLPGLDVGWLVGLYIAEGSQSDGTIQIAGHTKERERLERLRSIATDYDGYCFTAKTSANGATINVNSPVLLGVIDAYVSGRTAKDKHLNPRCWKRDNIFLSSVLAGYLSGDGHQAGNRWRLGFTDNDQWAADLRTLGARLGFSIRLKRTIHQLDGKGYPGWRGSLVFRPEDRRASDFEIVAIHASRARMFWDIALADEPHVFALAGGVLTHNSNPMPESVTDRPTKSHEYLFLLSKNEHYYYDNEAVREKGAEPAGKTAPFSKQDGIGGRSVAMGRKPSGNEVPGMVWEYTGNRNLRSVWSIPTEAYPGAHFATFPRKLVGPCVRAGTSAKGCCPRCGAGWVREVEREFLAEKRQNPAKASGFKGLDSSNGWGETPRGRISTETTGWRPGCTCFPPEIPLDQVKEAWPVPAVVLDPFVGSGTTLVVANALGRRGIGVDLSTEYLHLARRRITRPHARVPRTPRAETLPLFDLRSLPIEVGDLDGTID